MRLSPEDQRMRQVLIPMGIALLIGAILLILFFAWFFRRLSGLG